MSRSPKRVNNVFPLCEKDLSKAVLNSKAILFSDDKNFHGELKNVENIECHLTELPSWMKHKNDTENRENLIYEYKRKKSSKLTGTTAFLKKIQTV